MTDGERLRLALVNVLANARQAAATKGSGRGHPVELSTSSLDAHRVAIVVRDHGPGIRSEDLPRVFDLYFTTKRSGSGLGLAIARNIVEGLGGTIAATSRLNDGTEIRIELPRRPAAASSRSEVTVADSTTPPVATQVL